MMSGHRDGLGDSQGYSEANMLTQTSPCMQTNSMLDLSIIKKIDQGDSVSIHFSSVMEATWNKYQREIRRCGKGIVGQMTL